MSNNLLQILEVDPLGEQSNAATSSDTIEQVAQIPQTETKGEDNVTFTVLPMGDMGKLDPQMFLHQVFRVILFHSM